MEILYRGYVISINKDKGYKISGISSPFRTIEAARQFIDLLEIGSKNIKIK